MGRKQDLAAVLVIAAYGRTRRAWAAVVGKCELSVSTPSVPHRLVDFARWGHILTVALRFSPRFGFWPVSFALANSSAATALLAGPSHSSAVIGVTRSTHTFGSSGPLHHMLSVFRQIAAA